MKSVCIDETGNKYFRLTVLSRHGLSRDRKVMWLCLCDCGKETLVMGKSLRSGNTKSCGCFKVDGIIERSARHNAMKSPTYQSWRAMKERCNRKTSISYSRYGGKGVYVCDRWLGDSGFNNFLQDMGERPKGKTLDRKDNSLGYSKDNCRWATRAEQSRNTSRNVYITYLGQTKTITDWEVCFDLSRGLLRSRLKAGWTVKRALTEPLKQK